MALLHCSARYSLWKNITSPSSMEQRRREMQISGSNTLTDSHLAICWYARDRDETRVGVRQFIPGVSEARVAIPDERSKVFAFLRCPIFSQTRRKGMCHEPSADILCNVIPAKGRTQHSNMYFNASTLGNGIIRLLYEFCTWNPS